MGYPDDAPEREMLPLANPVSQDETHMRTTLLPSLLAAAEHNQRQRVASVRLFEIANVFLPRGEDELPAERLHVAGLLMGPYWSSTWNLAEDIQGADFYVMKGIVEQLITALGVAGVTYQAAEHPSLHPGQGAAVMLDGKSIGVIGKLRRQVQAEYDLDQEAYLFELEMQTLMAQARQYTEYQHLARFPAALRDIAVVVDDTPANSTEALYRTIRGAGAKHLSEVELFDVYENAEVLGPGRKQLAFHLSFRTPEGTLTDEQVDQLVAEIVSHLRKKLGAELRS